MKPIAIAGLFGCAAAVAGYLALSGPDKPLHTGSIAPSGPAMSADPRTALSVVNVDWRREGFGLTAVVDVSVRNNNGYAVRVDRISCRFRDKAGQTEDHAQGVYNIILPRDQKVIRDVSLGFVSEGAKGLDCRVAEARKES